MRERRVICNLCQRTKLLSECSIINGYDFDEVVEEYFCDECSDVMAIEMLGLTQGDLNESK